MDFKNKVVVVTGGAQGIGRCSAECFEMTRNMIYHNDFGWTLERRADGTYHRETLI